MKNLNAQSLQVVFEQQKQPFDTLKTELIQAFEALKPLVTNIFSKVLNNIHLQSFDTILFYCSDISIESIQVFVKESGEPTSQWDFRGDIFSEFSDPLALSVEKIFQNYKDTVSGIISLSEEEVFAHFEATNEFLSSSENEVHIFEELDIFIAEKIAQFYQKCIPKNITKWKNCYLDFLPDSEFHNNEVFDLLNNKWTILSTLS